MGKTVCVTGANGYVASWIVLKLLENGYKVHGTVRNPDKCGHLKELNGAKEGLILFQADVLDYESLLPAIRGCDGVFHTACPMSLKFDNPDDVLVPAIRGTRNVFTACHKENVKRIVMTSSVAAVFYDSKRPAEKIIDDDTWSDPESCKEAQMWYMLAKTEAEKLAWTLAKEYNLELITLCPVFVFGPLLQPTVNASTEVLKKLADGSVDSYSNTWIRIVDVRDVAKAHIRAFEDKNASGRYLCMERSSTHKELIDVMKKSFPQLKYPEKCTGDKTAEGIPPEKISNKKFKNLIGEFISHEQSIVDTILSLQNKGLLSN